MGDASSTATSSVPNSFGTAPSGGGPCPDVVPALLALNFSLNICRPMSAVRTFLVHHSSLIISVPWIPAVYAGMTTGAVCRTPHLEPRTRTHILTITFNAVLSSIAAYPSGTPCRPTVMSKTGDGSSVPARTSSISSSM